VETEDFFANKMLIFVENARFLATSVIDFDK